MAFKSRSSFSDITYCLTYKISHTYFELIFTPLPHPHVLNTALDCKGKSQHLKYYILSQTSPSHSVLHNNGRKRFTSPLPSSDFKSETILAACFLLRKLVHSPKHGNIQVPSGCSALSKQSSDFPPVRPKNV